jgi:predicted double-glycine peptidase
MEKFRQRLLFMLTTGLLCGAMIGAGAAIMYMAPSGNSAPATLSSVPDVRQSTNYSCGAACTQAVLNYYLGLDVGESMVMQELGTNNNGTSPGSIMRVLEAHGLSADMRQNLTLADLQDAISRKIPVIIVAQAWRDNTSLAWTDTWDSGHYMVVIGIDSNNVYFEDPSLLGCRGQIPRQEFLDRWHDDGGGEIGAPSVYNHMGIYATNSTIVEHPGFVPVM